MARVTIRGGARTYKAIRNVMKSRRLEKQLRPFAEAVLEAASEDQNETYVSGLRMRVFLTDRVTFQIGAAPVIGQRVEAKRGTLARALGKAGL